MMAIETMWILPSKLCLQDFMKTPEIMKRMKIILATHYLDDSKQDNMKACYPKLNRIGAYWTLTIIGCRLVDKSSPVCGQHVIVEFQFETTITSINY
jgi:hypothetical protein